MLLVNKLWGEPTLIKEFIYVQFANVFSDLTSGIFMLLVNKLWGEPTLIKEFIYM